MIRDVSLAILNVAVLSKTSAEIAPSHASLNLQDVTTYRSTEFLYSTRLVSRQSHQRTLFGSQCGQAVIFSRRELSVHAVHSEAFHKQTACFSRWLGRPLATNGGYDDGSQASGKAMDHSRADHRGPSFWTDFPIRGDAQG